MLPDNAGLTPVPKGSPTSETETSIDGSSYEGDGLMSDSSAVTIWLPTLLLLH